MNHEHPTAQEFESRLSRLASAGMPFDADVYRSCTPEYANENDLISGVGSRLHGGRWNPIGIAMIYSSLNPETAMAETLADCRYYCISETAAMPRTFVAMHVSLLAVLDLREGSVRRRLGVSETRMRSVDWRAETKGGHEPLTQRLGRAAHSSGWEGLIVPSAVRNDGYNLLVLPENLDAGSRVIVLNAADLRGR
jgi:RES domain-containing protein